MRAPDAPMGWPRATAPPFTFTFSGSAPSIFVELRTTEENASFSSTRSTSSIALHAFCWARRLVPALLRALLADADQRTVSVVDAGRVAGGRRPLGIEDRLQLREG